MAGPIITIGGVQEAKRRGAFERKLMRSQLLQQGLQQVAEALQSVGEYRKKEDLEKFGKLSTAAELMGGYNNLPADARTWLAQYAIGTTEGLPAAADGGPMFHEDLQKKWRDIEYQRRLDLDAVARDPNNPNAPKAREDLEILRGMVSPRKSQQEIEADEAKNEVEKIKAKYDYDWKIAQESNRTARMYIQEAGREGRATEREWLELKKERGRWQRHQENIEAKKLGRMKGTYVDIMPDTGIGVLVDEYQWRMNHPDRNLPPSPTYEEWREIHAGNEHIAKTGMTNADLAAQRIVDPAEKAITEQLSEFRKQKEANIKAGDEDASKRWDVIMEPLWLKLAEISASKGRSLDSMVARANELGGYFGSSPEQERVYKAIAKGYSIYQAGRGKLASDIANDSILAKTVKDMVFSPSMSSTSSEDMVDVVRELIRSRYHDIDDEVLDAAASGLLDKLNREAAEGIPRPE